jgi:hypothetical protein
VLGTSTLTTGDGDLQQAIPEWLMAWTKLGARARSWAEADGRLVVALSAPARAFAAVAVAFGHAVADYRHDRRLPTRIELDQQVDDLAPGELVRMVQPGWVRVARFNGRDSQGLIRLGSSRFPPDRIMEIAPLPAGFDRRERSYPVPVPTPPLAELLPGRDPSLFLTDTSLVCLLVGTKKVLVRELALPIGLAGASRSLAAIADLLRPFDPGDPTGWRSAIVPARAEELPQLVAAARPLMAILDGAQAVNNWFWEVEAPVVVVVLDRSDPGSEAAAFTVTQARAYATPASLAALGWTPPLGFEALAFREVR